MTGLRPYEPFTPDPAATLDRDHAVWPSVVWALLDGTADISDEGWAGSWTEAVTYGEYRRRMALCTIAADPAPTLDLPIGGFVMGRCFPTPKLHGPERVDYWDGSAFLVDRRRACVFGARAAALSSLLATLRDPWLPIDFDHLDATFVVDRAAVTHG